MNKTLFVFLAVAILSVHAFVKRDAPASESVINFDVIQKQLNDLKSQAEKAFDAETIKKNFEEFVNNVSKAVHSLNDNKEAPK